jgi:GT2 family glycosyltransferase
MTKMPVAGVVWQVLHYLLGFERLGYETYYVEAHARTPSMLMTRPSDDASELAASYIHHHLSRFGLGERWAFHALHDDASCHGMSRRELDSLYASAAALINLHGGTAPRDELTRTGRLVYLETDPVQLQIEIAQQQASTLEFLDCHAAFFTFAANYGKDDCLLPVTERYRFIPTRQPVLMNLWPDDSQPGARFTTIGNWKQLWRPVEFDGEVLTWSKHHEFEKVRGLPRKVDTEIELALSSIDLADIEDLESDGWRVRNALDVSSNIDDYRAFISSSRGEFTVAKEQNVKLRTGWFSDRSATYLAAGRPVVTQDTGYGHTLPVGVGLVPFTDEAEAVEAIRSVTADMTRHARAARAIARDYFSSDVVLPPLLEAIGLDGHHRSSSRSSKTSAGFPSELDLVPVRKHPTVLPPATLEYLGRRPVGAVTTPRPVGSTERLASLVVVTHDNLAFLRLCLESILASDAQTDYELVVVDNGSADDTGHYLALLAGANPVVRVIRAGANLGFAGGVNLGAQESDGDVLVILNDDVIVGNSWLDPLCARLDQDAAVGMVGPVTASSTSLVDATCSYRTMGEFNMLAERHTRTSNTYEVPFLTMFCVAMRRETFEAIGPLDEDFGLGLFEDDDYCQRLRLGGFSMWLEESVFVHHFGETSLGKLKASGQYSELFESNRRRYENKWGVAWDGATGPERPAYRDYTRRLRATLAATIPAGAVVLVVSCGDDELLDVPLMTALHFPYAPDGKYAGYYPSDGIEAVHALCAATTSIGARYLVIPHFAAWWLTFYPELGRHLHESARLVFDEDDFAKIFMLEEAMQ